MKQKPNLTERQTTARSTTQQQEISLEQSVERIIERNLLEVFNGRDAASRRATIDELWDKDGVFIDPGGVHDPTLRSPSFPWNQPPILFLYWRFQPALDIDSDPLFRSMSSDSANALQFTVLSFPAGWS